MRIGFYVLRDQKKVIILPSAHYRDEELYREYWNMLDPAEWAVVAVTSELTGHVFDEIVIVHDPEFFKERSPLITQERINELIHENWQTRVKPNGTLTMKIHGEKKCLIM